MQTRIGKVPGENNRDMLNMPSCRESNVTYARCTLACVYISPRVCASRYRKSGIHSCEIHVINIDGQNFTTTDDTGCLVCIDYRMHTHCENRRRYPECWNESRMCDSAIVRLACVYVHIRRFLSRIHSVYAYVYPDPSSTIVSPSKQRNLDAEIIGSAAFSDLFEIESIARCPREKCIYTVIEFHRVDCTIDTVHSLSFRWAAGRFQRNACRTRENAYN